ncbi:MAG: efflux RND transporter periplasmic adaptor subunit, partial [Chthoniobacterales bacterium]
STVVQNVVTYDTIIDFDNPQRKLFPGMTAYVTIPVASAKNVLKIPNAALRFKPDLSANELRALYRKAGIPEEGDTAGASHSAKTAPDGATSIAKRETRIIWRLVSGNTLKPVSVKSGITDHTDTELLQVVNGSLKAGDAVVTGVEQNHGAEKTPSGPGHP